MIVVTAYDNEGGDMTNCSSVSFSLVNIKQPYAVKEKHRFFSIVSQVKLGIFLNS